MLVVGLGLALMFFGNFLQRLTVPDSGWVAYAPLSNTISSAGGPDWTLFWHIMIWVGLIAVWVVASTFILRTPKPHPISPSEEKADE